MRLQSLKHLVEVAQAASKCERIVVLGSSSLLAFHPELGETGQPLETSFDADLLIEPCDEDLAALLAEAIGEERRFHARFGYHAHLLRPEITRQLPPGWEARLAPLPGCGAAFCIEPHDLAVAKLQAGRAKDLELLAFLIKGEMLEPATIRKRLASMPLPENMIVLAHRRLEETLTRSS